MDDSEVEALVREFLQHVEITEYMLNGRALNPLTAFLGTPPTYEARRIELVEEARRSCEDAMRELNVAGGAS